MRLPTDTRFRRTLRMTGASALAIALASCASSAPDMTRMATYAQTADAAGPRGDYPIVLGEPFTVDGTLYTPADTTNYDEVGYAGLEFDGAQGVTLSHHTLPLPSYVELTSLENGSTILARVERRGPMTGDRLVGLSSAAASQLNISEGGAIRVRRVNPPEAERAALRSGKSGAARIETPMSLVEVLREKLPARGSASLRSAEAPPVPSGMALAAPETSRAPAPTPRPVRVAAAPAPAATTAASAEPGTDGFDRAFSANKPHSTAYPLRPLAGATPAHTRVSPPPQQPVVVASAPAARATPAPAADSALRAAPRTAPVPQAPTGKFVVQAAAFSSQTNADRAASKIGGFVTRSGRYYRVRTGPFATRGQAEAALAKVRAAGYSGARVFTNQS